MIKPKICSKCKEVKESENFYPRKELKSGLSSHCKDCHIEYVKTYKINNELHVKEKKREWYEANKEMLLLRMRKRMYPEPTKPYQNTCEICGGDNKGKTLALDHNHDTNKFRGWLCGKCNSGLGFFNDSPKLMKLAIKYINEKK